MSKTHGEGSGSSYVQSHAFRVQATDAATLHHDFDLKLHSLLIVLCKYIYSRSIICIALLEISRMPCLDCATIQLLPRWPFRHTPGSAVQTQVSQSSCYSAQGYPWSFNAQTTPFLLLISSSGLAAKLRWAWSICRGTRTHDSPAF